MKALNFTKTNGEIADVESLLKNLQVLLKGIKNGEYNISIEPVRRQRTLSQNRLLWLWLNFIAEQTGNGAEELKQFFQYNFLQSTTEINGHDVTIIRGTSTLKKDEMKKFLDDICLWCAEELGMQLPQPEELIMLGYEHTNLA